MEKQKDILDAGLRSLDHYQERLPKWRHQIREQLLPIVRSETPYVAWVQNTLRSGALDTYFAVTANLGTHTFYLVQLPIMFWCGQTCTARAMVHVLAAGVYFTGFFKDMLCLPRPLSPPLTRITMSSSSALEYGFPSTHSTNAASVVVYFLWVLQQMGNDFDPNLKLALQFTIYLYAGTIVLGRLYCGMHGFFDVIFGGALGALIGWVQVAFGPAFDDWLLDGDFRGVLLIILVILVLVRVLPEPADDCPCFDDSVSFAGVFMGIDFATWHFGQSSHAWSSPEKGAIPFDLGLMGLPVVVARIVLGVLVIFAWKGSAKPTLLKVLPPIFRVVERLGLTLPRRFFKPASEYETIPRQPNDDNIIPRARDIPHLLSSFRKRRAVSVGPQSEADAYETLAYRDKRRRDSLNAAEATGSMKGKDSPPSLPDPSHLGNRHTNSGRKRSSSLEMFRAQMGTGVKASSPMPAATSGDGMDQQTDDMQAMDELQERKMFSNLQKPRVRYDVEVITRLVVYAGIGWFAAEGVPVLLIYAGLGVK